MFWFIGFWAHRKYKLKMIQKDSLSKSIMSSYWHEKRNDFCIILASFRKFKYRIKYEIALTRENTMAIEEPLAIVQIQHS